MPQHGRREADKVLLAALGCGATIEVAAYKAGVSEATVSYVVNGGRWGKFTGGKNS